MGTTLLLLAPASSVALAPKLPSLGMEKPGAQNMWRVGVRLSVYEMREGAIETERTAVASLR